MPVKSYELTPDFHELQRLHALEPTLYHSRRDIQQWLWDTHIATNEGVHYLVRKLLEMRRGAGVWRKRDNDGVWGEWKLIQSDDELNHARESSIADPGNIVVRENLRLVGVINERVTNRDMAIQVATCCARLVEEYCPPSDDGSNAQMPRDSLYLLLDPNSKALGLRTSPVHRNWRLWEISTHCSSPEFWKDKIEKIPEFVVQPTGGSRPHDDATNSRVSLIKPVRDIVKKVTESFQELDDISERWNRQRAAFFDGLDRPEWFIHAAVAQFTRGATDIKSWTVALKCCDSLLDSRGRMPPSVKKIVRKVVKAARKIKKVNGVRPWTAVRNAIASTVEKETKNYKVMIQASCLPLPGFGEYINKRNVVIGPVALCDCGSEWKLAMWNLAGQKVRSHLGWVMRRERENALLLLRDALFQHGGWIRTKNGIPVRLKKLNLDDILSGDATNPGDDFEQRPPYGRRLWFATMQKFEADRFVRDSCQAIFDARERPRIHSRTIKGWGRVRGQWRKVVAKNPQSEPRMLMDIFDRMRERKLGDFGSRDVFNWLADCEQRWLWDGTNGGDDNDCGRDDRDCIAAFATYNDQFARRRRSITLTENHATRHPVWAFFGENSAVKYRLERRKINIKVKDGWSKELTRLFVVFSELLRRRESGDAYEAIQDVAVPLGENTDFEDSFPTVAKGPEGPTSPKEQIQFRDDLLDGEFLDGASLGGIKLIWDRGALPRVPLPEAPDARIIVSFSCQVKPSKGQMDKAKADPHKEILSRMCFVRNTKNPRDGLRNLLYLSDGIRRAGGLKSGEFLALGQREWPLDAVDAGFAVTGNDQGTRRGLVGVTCRLTFAPTTGKSFTQPVGRCGGRDVFVEYARVAPVALPGDDQSLPPAEQDLRDRFYLARRRLNLQNALLKIVRLLSEDTVVLRKFGEAKTRERRSVGARLPCGKKVQFENKPLDDNEIRARVEKAGKSLLRWAGTDPSTATDAMTESLRAIDQEGTLWDWLAEAGNGGVDLRGALPRTVVPTKDEAKERGEDWVSIKNMRADEEAEFTSQLYTLRKQIANALYSRSDSINGRRGTTGLWAKLDDALNHEISYDREDRGLLRALRRPPGVKRNEIIDEHHMPLPKTFRGGLSIRRLSFLEDARSFVRKWSCRPRFPGDVRRLSRKQEFAVGDGLHIEHLREHRAKLLGHSAAAVALGFEQDLTRGIWLYRDIAAGRELWQYPEAKDDDRRFFEKLPDGSLRHVRPPPGLSDEGKKRPHRAFPRSHIMVFEDLGRYKFQQDRPKSENSRLSKWSHRRILKFAQHVGGLFGMPLALQRADYSSRFCSRCGAPGFRCSQFDAAWLKQDWMKRRLKSCDPRDKSLKIAAEQVQQDSSQRPWVLLDGGTHFVCANKNCDCHKQPIDADENAAANIGLWFLRGREDFRARIDGSGRTRSALPFLGGERFSKFDDHWKLESEEAAMNGKKKNRRKGKRETDDHDEIEADDDETGAAVTLFRDPSGTALLDDRWYEDASFWGRVAVSAARGIHAANVEQYEQDAVEELENQSSAD